MSGPSQVPEEHVRAYARWVAWLDGLPALEGERGVWLWVSSINGDVLGIGSTPAEARRAAVLAPLNSWLLEPRTDTVEELVEEVHHPGCAVQLVGDPIVVGRLVASLSATSPATPAWQVVAEVAGAQLARAS